LRYWFYDLF